MISNCVTCGGTHFGSLACPLLPAEIEKNRKAAADGPWKNRRRLKAETVEKLLDAAFGALQHDTGPQDKENVYLRRLLKGQFTAILDKPMRVASTVTREP